MATQQHIPGFDKPINWTADTGESATVHVTGWKANDGGDLHEVTNTGCNAEQAFIATIKRTSVNATFNFYKEVNLSNLKIQFGSKGTLECDSGLATDWVVHVIIEQVNWSQTVNGVLSINLDVKSDALKADGTVTTSITRPA